MAKNKDKENKEKEAKEKKEKEAKEKEAKEKKDKEDKEAKEKKDKEDKEDNESDDDKNITSIIFYVKDNNECDECNDCDDCDDPYNDSYFDDYNNNEDKKRKRDQDKQNNVDSFFKQIIEKINNKNIKKQKTEPIDDFKAYFTESDILLPIDKEIKTLKDLIELGKTYDHLDTNRYVINLRALNKAVKPLEELDAMIGMKNVKEMIIDLIFFRLQNIQDTRDNIDELWHLVIQGTPGSGKTEVAKIIGKLYYSLGIVKKDKFTLVRRSDLIGKYLGHTAKMTQEVFDNAKGGILFIDEAYSLGSGSFSSSEKSDIYSKECLDTINLNLTEKKKNFVCIIAGYPECLDKDFFSVNPGLKRRFPFTYNIDKYTADELANIFQCQMSLNTWSFESEAVLKNSGIKVK